MKFALFLSVVISGAFCPIFIGAGVADVSSKIVIEHISNDGVMETSDAAGFDFSSTSDDLTAKTMLVEFNSGSFERDESQLLASGSKNAIKTYYGTNNKKTAEDLGIEADDVYLSEYTPFAFYKYGSLSNEAVYEKAKKAAGSDSVGRVYIYDDSLYSPSPSDESTTGPQIYDDEGANADCRSIAYDNFPSGTAYTGAGIKIGLLDTGMFNTTLGRFDNITAETVYDNYNGTTANPETYHPTWVASVLGGKYGIASYADIYFVDVNSDCGYSGIEKLIDKGCSIVNMSISLNSCLIDGNYDTGLEHYLDYIYASTKVIMVAAAGNNLGITNSNGYVTFPALCANVIAVGSIDPNGVPSRFSCFNHKSDVYSKPNLVAVGEDRYIQGYGYYDGTSFSSPAVVGALALRFQKGGILNLQESLSLLTATSNSSLISKTPRTIAMSTYNESSGTYTDAGTRTFTNDYISSIGYYSRTGAGALDISAVLAYGKSFIGSDSLTFSSTPSELQRSWIRIAAGSTITASISFARNAYVHAFLWNTWYTGDALANFNLLLEGVGVNESTIYSQSSSANANNEMIRFTATSTAYYRLLVQGVANYSSIGNLDFAYSVS